MPSTKLAIGHVGEARPTGASSTRRASSPASRRSKKTAAKSRSGAKYPDAEQLSSPSSSACITGASATEDTPTDDLIYLAISPPKTTSAAALEDAQIILNLDFPNRDLGELAITLIDGTLEPPAAKFLFAGLDTVVRSASSSWTLSCEPPGVDASMDLSFPLRGFDNVSLEEQESIIEWHDEHLASRPLCRRYLPCALVGPQRFRALAGSSRQLRQTRRVPLEHCRVIRGPLTHATRGEELVTALLLEMERRQALLVGAAAASPPEMQENYVSHAPARA